MLIIFSFEPEWLFFCTLWFLFSPSSLFSRLGWLTDVITNIYSLGGVRGRLPSSRYTRERSDWDGNVMEGAKIGLFKGSSVKKGLYLGQSPKLVNPPIHPTHRFGTRNPLNFIDLGLLPWICRFFLVFTYCNGKICQKKPVIYKSLGPCHPTHPNLFFGGLKGKINRHFTLNNCSMWQHKQYFIMAT